MTEPAVAKILDATEEPTEDIRKFAPEEVGSTGLKHASGYVNEEFLPELKGRKGMRVYRQMADNDPVVGAMLFAINMLIRQSDWSMQPADDTEKAQEMADLAAGMLFEDMESTWEDTLTEILTMLPFGFAPMEVPLKRRKGRDNKDPSLRSNFDDGYWGIRKMALRAQETVERWEIAENGDILGLYQQPENGSQVFIPIENMLLFRTQSVKNNPEGRSILRSAYRPWFFKTRIEEIEGIGIERDLAGLPVVRAPGSLFKHEASPEDKRTLKAYKDLARGIKRDTNEGLLLPNTRDEKGNYLYEVSLLSSGGTRQFDTTAIVDRYDRRIAMTVLADFLFLGQTAAGSFALSSDKTALFATAIGSFLKQVAAPINRILLPELWRKNGLKYELMPTLAPGDIENLDLDQLGRMLTAMTGSGAQLFPDRELENALRSRMGLPEAPEDTDQDTVERDARLYGDEGKPGAKAPAGQEKPQQGPAKPAKPKPDEA